MSTERISDELLQQIRQHHHIVDLVGQYVPLKKVDGIIRDYVHSIPKRLHHLLFRQTKKSIIVLGVEQVVMSSNL